jgi:predicted RNA binding protein YcfA (HicA-like mRNA interferase family)
MSKFEKLITRLLSGTSDKNFSFADLVNLLESFGFSCRVKGSHHIFYRNGIDDIINIQAKESKAKPYQVKQVREIIVKYKLWSDDTGTKI